MLRRLTCASLRVRASPTVATTAFGEVPLSPKAATSARPVPRTRGVRGTTKNHHPHPHSGTENPATVQTTHRRGGHDTHCRHVRHAVTGPHLDRASEREFRGSPRYPDPCPQDGVADRKSEILALRCPGRRNADGPTRTYPSPTTASQTSASSIAGSIPSRTRAVLREIDHGFVSRPPPHRALGPPGRDPRPRRRATAPCRARQ